MSQRMWRMKNWRNHSAASLSSAKNTNSGIWQAQRTHIKSQSVFFIGAALYLCCLASAQTQGNAIYLIDSYNSGGNNSALTCGGSGNCIQYPEAVAVGDVLVVTAGQENASCGGSGVTNPPWTFSDSLGNTFHTQTALVDPSGTNLNIQQSCVQVTIPGTDKITVTGINHNTSCANSFSISRFKNASCTLDGSPVTGSTSAGSGSQTGSSSITTAVNGDVLVSGAMAVFGPQGTPTTDNLAMYSSYAAPGNAGFGDVLQNYRLTDALGSYSMGLGVCCSVSGSQQAYMQTIALKPATTIAIADTLLPDAAASVAYSAQLHCPGSLVAAPTYSLFSGSFPSGISLNTATGLISGSTSSTGTNSLQFKCTDGTNTSAAQALSLKVGAGFNSIVVKSSTTFDGNLQPSSVSVSASCGDLIVLGVNGSDTHGGIGWVTPASGVSNSWSDSFGSPVQRLVINGGIPAAPMTYYILGPLPTSGLDFVAYQNSGGGSSALPPASLLDISGAQAVIDTGTVKTANGNPVTSVAQSLTTVVPNEYVLASTTAQDAGAGFSFTAPFSLITSGNDGGFTAKAYASATVASPSTVTATTTVTGSPAVASIVLMALRPALPGACSFTGAGEKKRRSMN